MKKTSIIAVALAALAVAAWAQTAEEPTPAATSDAAPAPQLTEQQARDELTKAQIRLELVLARKSLEQGAVRDARQRAQHVLDLVLELPAEADMSAEELQAEGILVRAARSSESAEVEYEPAPSAKPTTAAHLRRQSVLEQQVQDDALRVLTEANAARLVPRADIVFPADWPSRVARREEYAGGQIARSNSWQDNKGEEWYVAIYEINDLTYVPPDFRPTTSLDLIEDGRDALDRHALRWGGAFNAYSAQEFASWIPLLHYFGGVDDYALRGPKYSAARQEQVVEMIRAFSIQDTEAKVISLQPTR